MSKLIMMSILIATIVIPMRRVMAHDPQTALRRAVKDFWLYNLFYTAALVYLVPRLL